MYTIHGFTQCEKNVTLVGSTELTRFGTFWKLADEGKVLNHTIHKLFRNSYVNHLLHSPRRLERLLVLSCGIREGREDMPPPRTST